MAFCAKSNYQWCGMEYGRECWGGGSLNSYSTLLNESMCNYACEGNATELCGGSLAITLYQRNGSTTTSAASKEDMAWGLGISMGLFAVMSAVFLGF